MDHLHPFIFIVSLLSEIYDESFVSRACLRISDTTPTNFNANASCIIFLLEFAKVFHETLKFDQVLVFS
jgi:hypothetical protein